MLAPVKDASRRYRGGQAAILDRPCAKVAFGWQVGTKGWPIRSNQGMDLGGPHNPGYANHPTQNPANSTYNVEEAC